MCTFPIKCKLEILTYWEQTEFEGRASWGVTFGGYSSTDANDHGTFLAGVVAGKIYEVAKLANIVAAKVLSDNGTGRKSVVLIALGSTISSPLDNAVLSVGGGGIPAVARGSNTDASSSNPAKIAQAITAAPSTQTNNVASFSNYESIVRLYAPGQDIALNTLSGQPGARIAGLAAYVPSLTGPIASAILTGDLIAIGVKSALVGVPSVRLLNA
ncbi:hypothetical protein P691DRAFT_785391 [Macrolepiota fuliginosa MF-IS2]|uniref:Peptidase S8/S53 domain-containing protein n=1 Tax=Macrolepiota fuliginosa MF-IS2 TaxID=1400762 RepID=A0A9P5XKE7_9AGAR|nr:hypothetical protein P691DRAFT_785391 [Macrolepiota fuliginosa MF-IS2]